MSVRKEYAVVTGGSSGMGLEYVDILASMGYNVIIVALFQEETDAVRDRMASLYPEQDFLSFGLDLSAREAPQRLVEGIREKRPDATVEVLVNNAGMLHAMHFRNMPPEKVSSIIMVHCHATAMLCSFFLPGMLARGKGYILNVSSLASWFPFPFLTTYASTKSFTRIFTRALRTECRKTGVKVSSVYFGAVDTPLIKLSPDLRKLARRLGVMISSRRAAEKALKMMFRGRSGAMPGLINKIACVAAPLLRPSLTSPIDRWATSKWNLK